MSNMKTSLYNQDGSLHSEAQFLLSFKSSNMSMGDWKKRMKAFKSLLSEEDLKEFERLKVKASGAEERAKKPKVIEQTEIREINLYDEDGCLHPEARKMVSLRPDGVTAPRWNKMLTAFMRCLSEEDAAAFLKLRVADSHKRRRLKILKTIPDWFDINYSKINLYDGDGSLCKEAQFLITLRIDILPAKEDRDIARLRLDHFKERLSKKDLETFTKIRSKELDNLKQARYRQNNAEKVRATDRKRNRVYMPVWNAANPEKAKARSDRYVAKRAAKRFQERLEKYPEFYAGWVGEETISLHKEDGTLFCDSMHLLILSNPENVPKRDWARILKDFRSKLSDEDNKEFTKLKREACRLKYYEANPEKVKATRQKTRSKPSYIEWQKAYMSVYFPEYYAENSKTIIANTSARQKEKKKTDPLYAAQHKLRKAVQSAFARIKKNKPADTLELLGCTWEEAKAHFESLFQEGMTWENHGMGDDKWHIDHIRPVCSFEDHELHLMNHISNLRPLWQKDNLSKNGNDRKQSVRNKAKESSDIIQESHVLEKIA